MTIRILVNEVRTRARLPLSVAVAVTAAFAPVGVAFPETISPLPSAVSTAFRGSSGHAGAFPAVGPRSLGLKYSVTTDADVNAAVVIGPDGVAYMASRDGVVRALSSAGVELWKSALGTDTVGAPVLTSTGDQIIIGDQKGRVKAFNAKTGDGAWVTPRYGQVLGAVTVGAEGRVWFTSTERRLIALDSDGELHRIVSMPADAIGSPALGPDNSLYVATSDQHLRKFSPDGDQLLAVELPYNASTAPVVSGASIVTIGVNTEIVRIDGSNGAILWRKSLGVRIRSMPAVGSDNVTYVGADDGRVVAIGADGTTLWTAQTGGAVLSAPAIDASGTVYVGSGDAILYAFDRTGARIGSFRAFDAIDSPITIGSDGTVFAGSRDNRLYALGDNSRRFASSPADRIGGDLIRDASTGKVYAMVDGTRRWIPDPITLGRLGLGSRVPTTLPSADLAKISEGPNLPPLTDGSIIRSSTGAVYRIIDGQRSWVADGDPSAVDAPDQLIRTVTMSSLNGAAIKGTDDRVYIVEDGFRRWAQSSGSLQLRNIAWSGVHLVTDTFRDSLPLGVPIP
jgi:outer membrane protein assembly factor BamB